jgi:hypothetical protein
MKPGCQMASPVGPRAHVLLILLLILGPLLMTPATPVTAQDVVTNETVIQMVRAGLSETVILAKIRSSQTKFDTRTEALIALKQVGVSESVMSAILGGGAPPAQAVAPPTAPVGAVIVVPSSASQQRAKGPVFHLTGGKQVELIAASGGIETSSVPYNRKTELVLSENKASYRTSDGQPTFLTTTEPSEMPLVRLDPGKNDRNLKISSPTRMGPYAGSSSQRGIRAEDRIDVSAERDQQGNLWIRPRAPLPPGEYAFVLTRSSGTRPSGTVYDFGVD